jgi:hypothetical protein
VDISTWFKLLAFNSRALRSSITRRLRLAVQIPSLQEARRSRSRGGVQTRVSGTEDVGDDR